MASSFSSSSSTTWKRQQGSAASDASDDPDSYDGWWSPEWMAIRYTIVTLLLLAFVLFFVGGYLHAQRRIRAGLAPLPYHSFLVRRGAPPQQYRPYYASAGPNAHPMQDGEEYQAPPPPYVPPPVYQPPEGASKVMADQHYSEGQGSSSGREGAGATAPLAPRQP